MKQFVQRAMPTHIRQLTSMAWTFLLSRGYLTHFTLCMD